jgi:hypothetical protein
MCGKNQPSRRMNGISRIFSGQDMTDKCLKSCQPSRIFYEK